MRCGILLLKGISIAAPELGLSSSCSAECTKSSALGRQLVQLIWPGHNLNPIWSGDCQPLNHRASLCQVIIRSLKPSSRQGSLTHPFQRERAESLLRSQRVRLLAKGLAYIFLYFLACPSPFLPGEGSVCAPWSAAILLLKTANQTPVRAASARREAARSRALQGRDGVTHWQDSLRSQDGSLRQGLFVCLQERLFLAQRWDRHWGWDPGLASSSASSAKLGLEETNSREGENVPSPLALTLPLHYFSSCISSYLIYFLAWLMFPSI